MSRRGSVYLVALLIVVVVSGIALVMARAVAVQLRAADRAVARSQCQAAAQGVLRAILSDLTASLAEGGTPALRTVNPAGEQLGDCLVFVIGRDPAGHAATFGLVADAGRIGVNSLADPTVPDALRTAEGAALAALPGMTPAIVAALRDWSDGDDVPDRDGGAERTDGAYLGATVPYGPRNAPMESLDEVRLVRDVTDALFFGGDRNRNGRLDPGETDGDGGVPLTGLQDVLALESREPSIAGDGTVRVPIIGGERKRLNPALSSQLVEWCGAQRGAILWRALQEADGAAPFTSRLELLASIADVATDDEVARLATHLIGPEGRLGLVDAWSCPDVLLTHLVGAPLAETLAKARPTEPPTTPGWLVRALGREQARKYGHLLTSGSYRFHADLLAVRLDGAGWVRLDAAIDCSGGSPVLAGLRPADGAGWPLPWCSPEALRRRDGGQDPATLLTTAPE